MTGKSDIQKTLALKIGSYLSACRKREGVTQGELAERIGVDTETVSRFERGVTMPSLATLQMLAVALNTTMADLVGESSPMPNDQAKLISSWLVQLSAEDREMLMGMLKVWATRLRQR